MRHRRPCPADCDHCADRAERLRDRLIDLTNEERKRQADMAADRYEEWLDRW